MIFAATMEEVFDRIFGTTRTKPRLSRIGGVWVCASSLGTWGMGDTPRAAYDGWKRVLHAPRATLRPARQVHLPPHPMPAPAAAPPRRP